MFNIIETHPNYLTRELLHDSLSSYVTLHFNIIVAYCDRLSAKIASENSSEDEFETSNYLLRYFHA